MKYARSIPYHVIFHSHPQFWIANQISIHPNGRWICVTNKYLQSTPRTVDLMFHADFSGAQEPSGNCFVLNNNQTDCLSYGKKMLFSCF